VSGSKASAASGGAPCAAPVPTAVCLPSFLNLPIPSRTDTPENRLYNFIFQSPVSWLNGLNFVNYDTYGFYVTTPQKTAKGVFFNGTDIFPIAYSLAGAGMVAYVGESMDGTTTQRLYSLQIWV
jgi:hypothetical protein